MRVFFNSERNHCHEVKQPQKETTEVSLGTHLLKPVHQHSGEQIQPRQPGKDCSHRRHPARTLGRHPESYPEELRQRVMAVLSC